MLKLLVVLSLLSAFAGNEEQKANDDLWKAINNNNLEQARSALKRGADIQSKSFTETPIHSNISALEWTLILERWEIALEFLHAEVDSKDIFLHAICSEKEPNLARIELISRLLNTPEVFRSECDSALKCVKDRYIARLLANSGCNPLLKAKGAAEHYFRYAVRYLHIQAVEGFLDAGISDYGDLKPLFWQLVADLFKGLKIPENLAMLQLFIQMGEDINQTDSLGNTPLMYGITHFYKLKTHHRIVIEELLKMGADPTLKNKEGSNPLKELAKKIDYHPEKSILDLAITVKNLIRAGADPSDFPQERLPLEIVYPTTLLKLM